MITGMKVSWNATCVGTPPPASTSVVVRGEGNTSGFELPPARRRVLLPKSLEPPALLPPWGAPLPADGSLVVLVGVADPPTPRLLSGCENLQAFSMRHQPFDRQWRQTIIVVALLRLPWSSLSWSVKMWASWSLKTMGRAHKLLPNVSRGSSTKVSRAMGMDTGAAAGATGTGADTDGPVEGVEAALAKTEGSVSGLVHPVIDADGAVKALRKLISAPSEGKVATGSSVTSSAPSQPQMELKGSDPASPMPPSWELRAAGEVSLALAS